MRSRLYAQPIVLSELRKEAVVISKKQSRYIIHDNRLYWEVCYDCYIYSSLFA